MDAVDPAVGDLNDSRVDTFVELGSHVETVLGRCRFDELDHCPATDERPSATTTATFLPGATYSPGNLTLTPPLTYHGLGDTTVAVGGDAAHTSKRLVRRQQETFGPPRRLALNTGRFGVANCSRYGVSQFFGV